MFYRKKLNKLYALEVKERLNGEYTKYAQENKLEHEFFYPEKHEEINDDVLGALIKGTVGARFIKNNKYGFVVWYFKRVE